MSAKRNPKASPADFVKECDGHNEITLTRPATLAGAKQGVVRMREPTAGDIESFANSTEGESTREMNTLANLCEVSPDEIRALPYRDYVRLQAAFALFTN